MQQAPVSLPWLWNVYISYLMFVPVSSSNACQRPVSGHQAMPARTQEIASTVICEQLVKARVNPDIKAVVIRVDSPGRAILHT